MGLTYTSVKLERANVIKSFGPGTFRLDGFTM